VKFNNWNNI